MKCEKRRQKFEGDMEIFSFTFYASFWWQHKNRFFFIFCVWICFCMPLIFTTVSKSRLKSNKKKCYNFLMKSFECRESVHISTFCLCFIVHGPHAHETVVKKGQQENFRSHREIYSIYPTMSSFPEAIARNVYLR